MCEVFMKAEETQLPEQAYRWWNSQRSIKLTRDDQVKIIERIVNGENPKDLAPIYRVSYATILRTFELYTRKPEVVFYAPGKVVMVLESKV